MSAESHAQLAKKVSIAAGIGLRDEGHRDNGPATRASSTHSAARRQSRLARPRQRTFEDAVGAPRLARLLEVLEELRRPVSCSGARPHNPLGLRTAFERTSRMRGLARECRKWAAPWAWQFERVAVLTLKGGQRRGCRKSRCTWVEQATEIAAAAECASRARGPSIARLPEPRPASASEHTQAQPHEDAAPLKIQGGSEGAEGLLAHPRGLSDK